MINFRGGTMFGKRAAESNEFNAKLNSNHGLKDIFSRRYCFVDPDITCGGKRPVVVRDEDGIEYMYRVLSTYSKVYENIKEYPICGVPKIVEMVKSERKTHVIEEKIDGVNLDKFWHRNASNDEKRAYHFMLQLCNILKELHSREFVHNDIKPSNIMVDSNQTVIIEGLEYEKLWLIDYDASKKIDRTRLLRDDIDTTIPFTKKYATIEQAQGCPVQETDISLMGQTFLEILGTSYAGMFKAILEKSAQLDYKKRYSKIEDLRNSLCKKKKEKTDLWSYLNWIDFRGRISRKTFCIRILLCFFIDEILLEYIRAGELLYWEFGYWLPFFRILGGVLVASTYSKRLHDINRPGWMCIFVFLFYGITNNFAPFIRYSGKLIVTSAFCFIKGDELPNKYGDTL